MRSAFITLALSALAVGKPMPASGCSSNYAGTFSISQVNVSSSGSKRSLFTRDTELTLHLHNGVLKDSQGRTGYIADNHQFQFDKPPQAGAIKTSGFSVCANGSLALESTIWISCRSGTFYNLYDENSSPQCFPVYLDVVGGGKGASSGGAPDSYEPAETSSTASPTGYSGAGAATAAVGSATAAVAGKCSQIGDGQAQCTTPASIPSCGEGNDGQPKCTSAAAKTPPPAPVTTATFTPSAACGVKSDGQPNCSQAPTYTGAPITPAPNAGNTFGVQHQMFGLAVGVLALAVY